MRKPKRYSGVHDLECHNVMQKLKWFVDLDESIERLLVYLSERLFVYVVTSDGLKVGKTVEIMLIYIIDLV